MTISHDGSTLYLADAGNNRIRKIDIASKQVSTLAGNGNAGFTDGIGTAARFNYPYGIAFSPDDSTLYVGDYYMKALRKIDVATAQVTTMMGTTRFSVEPNHFGISPDGNDLYVALHTGNVEKVDIATEQITNFASGFNKPFSVTVSPDNKQLYAADKWNGRIQVVDMDTKQVTTLKNGLDHVTDLRFSLDASKLYVTQARTVKTVTTGAILLCHLILDCAVTQI